MLALVSEDVEKLYKVKFGHTLGWPQDQQGHGRSKPQCRPVLRQAAWRKDGTPWNSVFEALG